MRGGDARGLGRFIAAISVLGLDARDTASDIKHVDIHNHEK